MKKLVLVLLMSGVSSVAWGRPQCTAVNPGNHMSQRECLDRTSGGKVFCEYNRDCEWTRLGWGSCEALDDNDSFAKTMCPDRTYRGEQFCELDRDCVWIN